jgi:hypothetical protein
MRKISAVLGALISLLFLLGSATHAQETLGSINGTVKDSTGATISGASVKAPNVATNLEQSTTTKSDGSFAISDLPIGTYEVTVSRDGFKTEVFSQIVVQGSRTATVNATLQPGEISSQIPVSATPLLDDSDTTNGYS